jgi:hypothetical protein
MIDKKQARLRRARKTRAKIAELKSVRLSVHRSNCHIYAQVISACGTKVLAAASSLEPEVRKSCRTAVMSVPPRRLGNWLPSVPGRPGSSRSRSIVPGFNITDGSRRWPRRRVKPASSSDRRTLQRIGVING